MNRNQSVICRIALNGEATLGILGGAIERLTEASMPATMNDDELYALAVLVHRENIDWERGSLDKPDRGAELVLNRELRDRGIFGKRERKAKKQGA